MYKYIYIRFGIKNRGCNLKIKSLYLIMDYDTYTRKGKNVEEDY